MTKTGEKTEVAEKMSEEDEKLLVPDPITDAEEENKEEQLTGCGGSLACDPRRNLHRYLVLIIMCFLSFGTLSEHC